MAGTIQGSAEVNGDLWGARARDWASLQEGTAGPLYEASFASVGLTGDKTLLDIGCGSGGAAEVATRLGIRVKGLDAAPALIALARERVPTGDFRVGEMEALPYADDSFDVVTGFNSFQYAAEPVHALSEARRVARPGGAVVIATWGRQQDCEAAGYIAALGSCLPPPPPGAPGPFALSDEEALKSLASKAGLTPKRVADVDCPFVYPDEETALRALLSSGVAVRAIRNAGEERARQAARESIAPYRLASGSYRMENKFRFLIATA